MLSLLEGMYLLEPSLSLLEWKIYLQLTKVLVQLDQLLVIVIDKLLQLEKSSVKVLGKQVEERTDCIDDLDVVIYAS